MSNLFPKSIGLLTAMVLMVTGGCTLEDPDPTTFGPPLTLKYTEEYSLTHFSWDRVKVTGFKEYILLQSNQPIPDKPTPEVNQNVSILKRIKDVDENFLTTSNLLIGDQTCYKLYCAVDDRFMYSPTICIDQSYISIASFIDKAAHLKGSDAMVGYDRVNDKFSVFNYKTGNVTNDLNDPTFNFPSLEMYQWNNSSSVLAFNQSAAWLGVYNFPSMSTIQKRSFVNVIWTAREFKQFVLMSTQQTGGEFQVLNKNTLFPLDVRPGTPSSQNMAVFEGDPTVVLTLGQTGSKKYTISDNGFILSEQSISGRIGQPDLQHTCAQGNELFIGGNSGDIINRSGENVGSLSSGNNTFVLLVRLSADESKAIYILSKDGLLFLEIADLSALPDITVERTIELPQLTYADLIPDDDIIHVIGTTFNSNFPETFILKYPW